MTPDLQEAASDLLHIGVGSWQDISTAPRDGTEFACGWFFQGRFVRDLGKFYRRPSGEWKLIQARYRHVLYATHWCALPPAPEAA